VKITHVYQNQKYNTALSTFSAGETNYIPAGEDTSRGGKVFPADGDGIRGDRIQ